MTKLINKGTSHGSVVKNSPANAGDVDSIPGWETKPTRGSYWACAAQLKQSLHVTTKILHAATKTWHSQINKCIFKLINKLVNEWKKYES